MPKRTILAAYVPVLHRGYMQLFDAFLDVDELYVFDSDLLKKVDYIRKDLRSLTPNQQVKALSGIGRFKSVHLINEADLKALDKSENKLIMPDEDISREFAKLIKNASVELYPIFLRWDRSSVQGLDKKDSNEIITSEKFAKEFMNRAMERAGQSSDIWRKVGAVLVTKDEEVQVANNKGEPTEHSPWIEGDPRNIFNRGVAIEMSVFTHAEAGLIAESARRGIKLANADIYVTTFPCPACAKLIAHAGIKTCYYKDGYAVLDGKRVMNDYGVKLIKVEMPEPKTDKKEELSKVPYKTKK
jgi:dCMP deaminase